MAETVIQEAQRRPTVFSKLLCFILTDDERLAGYHVLNVFLIFRVFNVLTFFSIQRFKHLCLLIGWLGSRVVIVLDSGAVGPGLKSQPRRCRVTVLGKLFTPIVPLFTNQRGCEGNCESGRK